MSQISTPVQCITSLCWDSYLGCQHDATHVRSLGTCSCWLTASMKCQQLSINICCPCSCCGMQHMSTDGTDGRTVNRCIEPAMHTEQAASVMYTLHHTAVRQWSLVLMLPASINGYILCCISQLSDYWWHPAMDWMKKLLHLFVVQHYHIIVCCPVCFSRITCIA